MNEPLVSVIICVYNGANYLAETITSVIKQEYPNIELIVIDDGSTDSSAEIATSFSQVNLIIHEVNQGLPSARNTGIQAARGEYLAILDADDLWPPHKISTQVEFHKEHPEYKYSFTQEKFLYEDMDEQPNWSKKRVFQEDHVAYIAGSMLIHHSLFETIGLFNPEYRNGDTTDWIFRAKDGGFQGGIIEKVLLYRRVHEENLSSNVDSENKTLFKALKSSINRQKNTNDK